MKLFKFQFYNWAESRFHAISNGIQNIVEFQYFVAQNYAFVIVCVFGLAHLSNAFSSLKNTVNFYLNICAAEVLNLFSSKSNTEWHCCLSLHIHTLYIYYENTLNYQE